MNIEKKNRIFISYSSTDKVYAERVADALRDKGIEVFIDSESINVGDNIFERLQYQYESNETVLLLLSKGFHESMFSQIEGEKLFNISQKRKISIIPIQIENCKIPDSLRNFSIINISNNFEIGIEKIIDKLKILPEINLEKFQPAEFVTFVHDLLKEYGFRNLTWQYSDVCDFGFDLMGCYWNKDPFGNKTEETWLVEIKYYGEDRFSINSIEKLIALYNTKRVPNTKVLLVTNSILTSVAEEFLKGIRNKENVPVSVLDGNAIKRLVAKRKRLINRYFRK